MLLFRFFWHVFWKEPLHHDGAQEEGVRGQVGQNREGPHLAFVPDLGFFKLCGNVSYKLDDTAR